MVALDFTLNQARITHRTAENLAVGTGDSTI